MDVDEREDGPPQVVARENAMRKALAGAGLAEPGEWALGVDTLVCLGERIWGKPADEHAARRTLQALSGRTHTVISGVAMIRDGEVRAAGEHTRVMFRTLSAADLEHQLAAREWQGRAGAYAIQGRGALLAQRIEGDYLNVVGFPVAALVDLWPQAFAG